MQLFCMRVYVRFMPSLSSSILLLFPTKNICLFNSFRKYIYILYYIYIEKWLYIDHTYLYMYIYLFNFMHSTCNTNKMHAAQWVSHWVPFIKSSHGVWATFLLGAYFKWIAYSHTTKQAYSMPLPYLLHIYLLRR